MYLSFYKIQAPHHTIDWTTKEQVVYLTGVGGFISHATIYGQINEKPTSKKSLHSVCILGQNHRETFISVKVSRAGHQALKFQMVIQQMGRLMFSHPHWGCCVTNRKATFKTISRLFFFHQKSHYLLQNIQNTNIQSIFLD